MSLSKSWPSVDTDFPGYSLLTAFGVQRTMVCTTAGQIRRF